VRPYQCWPISLKKSSRLDERGTRAPDLDREDPADPRAEHAGERDDRATCPGVHGGLGSVHFPYQMILGAMAWVGVLMRRQKEP
jgi:hypothetical protein